MRRFVFTLALVAFNIALSPRLALAWGDEGHEIMGKAASHTVKETAQVAK